MFNGVLVVITNFARPQNMPSVIRAWREQSVAPVKIVVVDNSPDNNVYRDYKLNDIMPNDIWRWTENCGCPCRFAPALMLYGHKYVLFADDDFLPGKRAIEWLLTTAKSVNNEFATIGQVGRRLMELPSDGPRAYSYDRRNVQRSTVTATKVDLTCRANLVQWNSVVDAIEFRNQMLNDLRVSPELGDLNKLVGVHDDFLLCCGIQARQSLPSYTIPQGNDPETELIKTEIPSGPEACYRRLGHYEERDAMCKLVTEAGWRSQA